ncbi:MAG TPA: CPBP family intramembrane glutamic endopeptidase [Acidobacteriota bacterium]|nr:CPBP family intramembrane glutamic endopeptidase [Acidobacteriota bacterium]
MTDQINRSRVHAAAEIAFVVLCVLIAEWVVIPIFGRRKSVGMIPVLIVFVFGFLSHKARREGAREIGFSRHNFVPALRLLILWMIPAAIALLTVGWFTGGLHFSPPRNWSNFALSQFWLFVWGLMQQYALQAIVNRRTQEIWGRGVVSVILVALLFCALHFPNLWLMVATLAGGILWAAIYQRYPNLYALAVSHSIMTTVLASSISPDVLHGLRVGYNYF